MYKYFSKQSKNLKIFGSILVVTITAIIIPFLHQYSHFLFSIDNYGYYNKNLLIANYLVSGCISNFDKPLSIIAGPFSLLVLSIISITLLNYFPKNIFLASIGFIAASNRLGIGLVLFFNLFFYRNQPPIINDELLILNMLNLNDIAIANAFLFFYLMIYCVLIILTIRIYDAECKIKSVVIASAILLQIIVNFYLKNSIVNFLLN